MDMLAESFERLIRERATPALVRAIEAGESHGELLGEIEASGFLDLLVPESAGGAALPLNEAFSVFLVAGSHALPLPFVQTVMARGWLHGRGADVPQGLIAIAGPEAGQDAEGRLILRNVAFGRVAEWILAEIGDRVLLLPAVEADIRPDDSHGSLSADLSWSALPDGSEVATGERLADAGHADTLACTPTHLCAAALAVLMAGAAKRALDMTLTHVAERQQFGRPISQFQAVQNQISVMAERVWAMRMAARLAMLSVGGSPDAARVALGKARCSVAAAEVADIAHALHGAIGITEEFDLQLYTRRLREWRRAGGTEAWWARRLGRAVIESGDTTALDFILDTLRVD